MYPVISYTSTGLIYLLGNFGCIKLDHYKYQLGVHLNVCTKDFVRSMMCPIQWCNWYLLNSGILNHICYLYLGILYNNYFVLDLMKKPRKYDWHTSIGITYMGLRGGLHGVVVVWLWFFIVPAQIEPHYKRGINHNPILGCGQYWLSGAPRVYH